MRPTWNEYFIGLSYYISCRSHDSETHVGCVLVENRRVVGVGYNGFPSGMDDSELPTTRPLKYHFMVHAEENAVSNIVINSFSPKTAYITHLPCGRCAKLLWQNNIREWYVPEDATVNSHSLSDEIVYTLLKSRGLKVNLLNTNKDNIRDMICENLQ